jgi:hypothetical protein
LHLRRHFNTCNLIAPDGNTWKIRLHNVETWPYYLPEYSFLLFFQSTSLKSVTFRVFTPCVFVPTCELILELSYELEYNMAIISDGGTYADSEF